MPFDARIDHEHRRVYSRWRGAVDEHQFSAYIDDVWSDPRVRDYDELIDFRAVTEVELSAAAVQRLVERSRALDNPAVTARSVLVASAQLAFGLSRMFVSMRDADPDDRREWMVLGDYAAAERWLCERRQPLA